ncbi:hypothetical protein ABLT40_12915 [Acinetobacter schindleri]|uniref:hypothetical protein n=1 Tax=Acinetobacter schindleri TaxID=108981 RepID=UPI0032B43167
MMPFTIEEAIKIINRKTDQSLTRRHIARLCESWELQVCFECQTHNCYLGICDESAPFYLISEAKLIGIRGVNNREPLYLTPSYDHADAVFDAIAGTSEGPIEIQLVRNLSHKRQRMLLIRDLEDQYLYDIDSKYKNGWQLFDSPKYLFEFEREGASASYTITVDRLRITETSLNAYIAKTKANPKKEIDKYSPGKTRECVEDWANYVLSKEGSEVVTKGKLAAAIFEAIKNTNHINNLKGDGERKIRDWLTPLKKWGEVGRPKGYQAEQAEVLIKTSLSQKNIDEINRQN